MASAIQMAKIADDPDFKKRVEYFMTRKALAVAAQTEPVPDGNDNALIQRIARGAGKHPAVVVGRLHQLHHRDGHSFW
jgi:hypothetical protein